MKHLSFSILLWLLVNNLSAQTVFFEKIFGTPGSDFARAVKQLPDGSIYVAGFSDAGPYGGYDASLCRLDRYGNLQWIKYYGDTFDNNGLYMNKCSDGNLVITGEQQSASTGLDVFVYKVDTAGNIIWQHTYGTALNESCKYIEQTLDGGYVLCGFQNDPYGSNNIYVLKIDSVGTVQWSQSYGGQDNDYSDMVHQLADGNYIITADTRSMGAGGYDVYLILTDSLGNTTWDFTYGDAFQNGCQGLLLTSTGKYLSYGETEIYLNSAFDFYVEMIDASGNSLWRRTMGGPTADAAFSAAETPDGGFILTGYSNSYQPGPISVVVLKTDSAGNFQWAREYGSEGIDIGYDMVPSLDNGFLIAAKTYVNNNDEYYLLHIDQSGSTSIGEERPSSAMTIYPNPSAGQMNIAAGEPGSTLKVFSTEGRLVYNTVIPGISAQVDLGALNCGIYIVELSSAGSVTHQRVIISRP